MSRIFGGDLLMDCPADASITSHQVRNGDVLVFATDGVWDNLNSLDLLKIVSRQMQGVRAWAASNQGMSVSDTIESLTQEGSDHSLQTRLAVAITGEAKMASLNTKVDGPFARQVRRYYPHDNFRGGKVDDICVLVAIAVSIKPA
jgi:protein phosphatase PTC7